MADTPLVGRHHFDHGHDRVHYFNFTFGTVDLAARSMAAASMAKCEGPHGWDDYLLLHHFDPMVKRNAL